MTAREVVKQLLKHGCTEDRQKGSHRRFTSPCGKCHTTVAMHSGDIKKGTLASINRHMTPCLGEGWLYR